MTDLTRFDDDPDIQATIREIMAVGGRLESSNDNIAWTKRAEFPPGAREIVVPDDVRSTALYWRLVAVQNELPVDDGSTT